MPNRIEARPAKAALTNATGRLPLLRLFSTPLDESLQKNPGQKPSRIRGTKIERALPDSVDRFLQEFTHFPNAPQRSLGKIAFVKLTATILLSSLPARLRQSLGVSVAKAQPSFHGRRWACTASLRPGLALFPAPLFQAFLSLKTHWGYPLGSCDPGAPPVPQTCEPCSLNDHEDLAGENSSTSAES
jgi:hypothetical protein